VSFYVPKETFSGPAAVDFEGGAISGTRFRWTASRAGEETVLCEGSDVASSSGGGGFAAKKSCSRFTARLAGHHYAGNTLYTIKLEVTDADGNTGSRQTTISVYTPPVG
jgi:serine protease